MRLSLAKLQPNGVQLSEVGIKFGHVGAKLGQVGVKLDKLGNEERSCAKFKLIWGQLGA